MCSEMSIVNGTKFLLISSIIFCLLRLAVWVEAFPMNVMVASKEVPPCPDWLQLCPLHSLSFLWPQIMIPRSPMWGSGYAPEPCSIALYSSSRNQHKLYPGRGDGHRCLWENMIAAQASLGGVRHWLKACFNASFSARYHFHNASCVARFFCQNGVKDIHFLSQLIPRFCWRAPRHHSIVVVSDVLPSPLRGGCGVELFPLSRLTLSHSDCKSCRIPHKASVSKDASASQSNPLLLDVNTVTKSCSPSTWWAKKKVEYTVAHQVLIQAGAHAH